MSAAIDLRNITKMYGRNVHALRGVSLHVGVGEVFGLLGPNGAGKSTLVKIMMSVVRPTRASGTVLDRPVGHKPTLGRIGYLPENHRFPKYLTGRQVLEFFAALAKVGRPTRRRRAAELLETVGMAEWADTKIATYSKGMMQRIGLAQALVHDPELIVLDEPTDGVDPLGRRDILDVLGRLREQHKTVFINSHALSELESICNRVAILVKGLVARQGSIDELTIARQRYEIEVAAGDPAPLRQRLLKLVAAQWKPSGIECGPVNSGAPAGPLGARSIDRGTLDGLPIELEGRVFRIGTVDPRPVQTVLDRLRHAGLVVARVQQVRPSLEDLFLDTLAQGGVPGASMPGAARAPAEALAGAPA